MIPDDLKYTAEHEWVRLDGDVATIGVTDHAQEALSDIVFVELPPSSKELAKGDEAAVLESTKAAASIYAPAAGTTTEGNEAVIDDPSLVNSDCYGRGWIYKLKLTDAGQLDSLMDAKAYEAFLASQGD